ncbi:hypothetical protein CHUAL_006514 [Chamberlinius hualienensis]
MFTTLIVACFSLVSAQNCVNDTYDEIMEGIKGVNSCIYPTDKFAAECVAVSCPKLTNESLCPTFNNGSLDQKNVEKILQTIGDCLKQKSICDVPINEIPIPIGTYRIDQLLQGTPFIGHCSTFKDGISLNNVNSTTVTLVFANVSTQSLLISISVPNLSYDGQFDCYFESEILSSMFGRKIDMPLQNIDAHIPLAITVDKWFYINGEKRYSDNQFTKIDVNPELSPFDHSPILKYLGVHNVFTYFLGKFIEISPVPDAYGNFISTIVKSAFEVTKQHC